MCDTYIPAGTSSPHNGSGQSAAGRMALQLKQHRAHCTPAQTTSDILRSNANITGHIVLQYNQQSGDMATRPPRTASGMMLPGLFFRQCPYLLINHDIIRYAGHILVKLLLFCIFGYGARISAGGSTWHHLK